MKAVQIRMAGKLGLNLDNDDIDLQPEEWSDGQNIRCIDGQIGTFAGYDNYYTPAMVAGASDAPYYIMPFSTATTYYWATCGLDKIYVFNGSTDTDKTRAAGDYTGTASDRWNGCILGGIPILNNGVDDPQYQATVGTGNFADLANWPASTTCRVLRTFKNFLIALAVTESSTYYPTMIRWSDAADPGTVPGSWDYTDPTVLAGRTTIQDGDGDLVDALQLNDILMLYRENSVHAMQFVGGSSVFRIYRVPQMPGLFAQDCVVEMNGAHIALAKNGNLYRHDGQTPEFLSDARTAEYLRDNIDPDNYGNTFLVKNEAEREVWICYPKTGATHPTEAMVYNYVTGAFSIRDLPSETGFIAPGTLTEAAITWNTLPYGTWDAWSGSWGARNYSAIDRSLVGVSPTSGSEAVWKFDYLHQEDGSNMTVRLERSGIVINDIETINSVTRIYPIMNGNIDVSIYVGKQDVPNGSVTWESPVTFTPGTDRKIDVRVTGNIHAIKFVSENNGWWNLSGYDIEYIESGLR